MLQKIPNTFVIIFFLLVFAALLTWIIPGGEYTVLEDGTAKFTPSENTPQSWQVFTAFQEGFIKQAGIIVFIIIIGGVFWIINSSKAIDVAIHALLRKLSSLEGKRVFSSRMISQIILVVICLVFSVFGAVFGMSEETIAFVGIVIPLVISLGYDSITGVAITFVAAGLGFAGAILNPFTIGIAQGIAQLPLFSGIEYRLFCWVIINIFGIGYILWYARKVYVNPKASLVYDDDKVWRDKTSNQKSIDYYVPKISWVMYFATLAIMIYFSFEYPLVKMKIGESFYAIPAIIILTLFFGVSGFISLLKSVHYFIITILGSIILFLIVGVMGFSWYINEISAIFLAGGIITGISLGKSGGDIVKLFTNGVKDILDAALIVGLAGGVIVLLENGNVVHSILHSSSKLMTGVGKVASIEIMYAIQTVINIVLPSGSAQAAITMPIMAPFSDLIGVSRQAIVMAFQFGDGFTNLITPTSAVLMGVLGVSKISYTKWIKWILPLIIMLTILGILLLIPTVSMSMNGF